MNEAIGRGAHVGIVTVSDDFHAELVAHRIRQAGGRTSIVPMDRLPWYGRMTWCPDGEDVGWIADAGGERLRPADLDVIWWRRNGVPLVPDAVKDPDARRVVARNSHATAWGLFTTRFPGAWVSHPDATSMAENKLVQLDAASAAGLRIPRTLVSQEPSDIRAFSAECGGDIIAKTVRGALDVPLRTGRIDPSMLADDEALSLCPTIFQEYVPGNRHLRVCLFGARAHGVLLESDELDWRDLHDVKAWPVDVDEQLVRRLDTLMSSLNLRMGVFDLKLPDDGEPVWLEVNPQGQFLFLEGLCGIPLARYAAEFLLSEAA